MSVDTLCEESHGSSDVESKEEPTVPVFSEKTRSDCEVE